MKKKLTTIALVAVLALTGCTVNEELIGKTINTIGGLLLEAESTDQEETFEHYTVKRVVDGDTFVIEQNGKDVKVRLIGVDTPESVASQEYLDRTGKENTEEGKKASEFTRELIEGEIVHLEFDAQTEDRYGRLLAYVYLDDGRMLQDVLLEEGYANLATYPPNVKYVDRFEEIVQKRN